MAKTFVSAVKPGRRALHVHRAFLFLQPRLPRTRNVSARNMRNGRWRRQLRRGDGRTLLLCFYGLACMPARQIADLPRGVAAHRSGAVCIYIDNAGCSPYTFRPPGAVRAQRGQCTVAASDPGGWLRPNGPVGLKFFALLPVTTVAGRRQATSGTARLLFPLDPCFPFFPATKCLTHPK